MLKFMDYQENYMTEVEINVICFFYYFLENEKREDYRETRGDQEVCDGIEREKGAVD